MASTTRRYNGPQCPQAPRGDHGQLLDWPTATAAFYCPHAAHAGNRFYRTDLTPAERTVTAGSRP